MLRKLPLVALVLLACQSALASTIYTYTRRFNWWVDYFNAVSMVTWYPGPTCDVGTCAPDSNCLPTYISYSSSREAECASQGQTQFNVFMASITVDPTKCYTYTTAVTSDSGCPVSCPDGGYCANIDPYLCTVTISTSDRPKEVHVPAYIVQSLNYAIPGNRSTITYTDASTRGSIWETKTTASANFTVGWELKLAGLTTTTGLKLTGTSTRKTSIQSSATWTDKRIAPADVADHTTDVFTLWFNPTLTSYAGCGFPDLFLYGAAYELWDPANLDPSWPIVEDFSVAEIASGTSATPHKQLFLQQLTAAQRQDILKLDPLVLLDGTPNPTPYLDRNRFRPVQAGLGTPCPSSFSGISALNIADCNTKYSYSQEDVTQFDANWQEEVKLAILGVNASDVFSVAYSRSVTNKAEDVNSATIHLETSTPGVCITGQLAIDTMFNTYVIPSNTHPCP